MDGWIPVIEGGRGAHLRLHQLGEVGLLPDVVLDAVHSPLQRGTSHQQDDEDEVGEEGCEVDHLPRETSGGHQFAEGRTGLCRI